MVGALRWCNPSELTLPSILLPWSGKAVGRDISMRHSHPCRSAWPASGHPLSTRHTPHLPRRLDQGGKWLRRFARCHSSSSFSFPQRFATSSLLVPSFTPRLLHQCLTRDWVRPWRTVDQFVELHEPVTRTSLQAAGQKRLGLETGFLRDFCLFTVDMRLARHSGKPWWWQ